MYNPYNSRNRVLRISDIQNVLTKHNCTIPIKSSDLFQTAMVHSSYVKRDTYTNPMGEPTQLVDKPSDCLELFEKSYEQLEHLGDSILGACVSTYLCKRFPSENEGFLTDLKKELVCNETLGQICQKIGLDKFYIISRHNEETCNGRMNLKKLGDIMEAFIGALWTYSNNDFQCVYNFIICLVETYMNIPKILMNNRNYKEQFQRVYQGKYKETPTYKTLESSLNLFKTAVVNSRGDVLGVGLAATKKLSEQMAAKDALSHSHSLLLTR